MKTDARKALGASYGGSRIASDEREALGASYGGSRIASPSHRHKA